MDTLTPEERSRVMARVRSKDTRPELAVRRLLHGLGYRYRLHRRDLPGCPDLVFPSRRKLIFVHGCFWHRHNCKLGRRTPKSRVGFWTAKFEGNRSRDRRNRAKLRRRDWAVLMVWECQLRDLAKLTTRLTEFLGPPGIPG